ncbi:tryptophan halogenase [Saccharobesus litoralis]|uniref:Tryptophan halogenase n=1 Tax=Saccharobesus litoralis TaxID=2172099 RepID=A0A2S0VTQ5_9ALTE|nr:tryptophan halogenase family protein [Saccharobesus litoralis]AWB67470.1 tryptophan halogenase [Saccharobesus litoralis]
MNPNTNTQRHILILGGGTAGWMAANLMAVKWRDYPNIKISLMESPQIGIIGVGEGSTPQLRAFFNSIDVEESQWMKRCNATYKVGITFANWSTKPGFTSYFHPFYSQVDSYVASTFKQNTYFRRKGANVEALPDHYFLGTYIAQQALSPKADHNFPFDVHYGYHFDSHLLGEFLKELAISRGVNYIEGKVNHVELANNGDIHSLLTEEGQQIQADFFVDSSGFRSVLLQQALKVPFKKFNENLFNDSAVVLPTEKHKQLQTQTVSTALKYGWTWDIPLTNRTGNGYVYDSNFCSAQQAEQELREKLNLVESDVEARHLKMKVGRVEKHWSRNCVAIGLAQGFIEPLEATALDIVQDTVLNFMAAYQSGNFTDKNRDMFNERVNKRFEGVRDYIVAHYAMNSRDDTEYWIANREHKNWSNALSTAVQCWNSCGDMQKALEDQAISDYFPEISWYCLMAGYGCFPDKVITRHDLPAQKYSFSQVKEFMNSCAINHKSHLDELANI